MKRQIEVCEEIFAKHIFNKELVSRKNTVRLQTNKKKIDNPIKMGKRLKQD